MRRPLLLLAVANVSCTQLLGLDDAFVDSTEVALAPPIVRVEEPVDSGSADAPLDVEPATDAD